MGFLTLNDNSFYTELLTRKTNNAITYVGILQPVSLDINIFLEHIKVLFPEYPGHDIQHSLRILSYLSKMISKTFLSSMTDTELFCLIMAALFHDTGMALYNTDEKDELRDNHHEFSTCVLDKYFEEKLPILQYRDRLKAAIAFACKAHGLGTLELYGSEEYKKRDNIASDSVRFSILASLIRIGDLMDLDSDRVNEFVLSCFSSNFSKLSKAHNERHLRVQTYFYDENNMNIDVFAKNIEEYKIWSTWLNYINTEILYINSYLSSENLHFPIPNTKITKDENANFEVEEIHFEVDDSGGIWKILSRSIYTNKFDFVRELVQNAIDATLMKIYVNDSINLKHISPRFWNTDKNCCDILIGCSEKRKELFVIDSGIGMNHSDLKRFLFKMTGSGYSSTENREFSFPSIAKFGIGFVSCLINASDIEIFTKKYNEDESYKVTLTGDSNLAITEKINIEVDSGTVIRLKLKQNITYTELKDYLKNTFVYPSVSITCFDVDDLEKDSNIVYSNSSFDAILENSFNLGKHFWLVEKKKKEIDLPFKEKENFYRTLIQYTEELYDWIHKHKDPNDSYSDANKYVDFKLKIETIIEYIEKHSTEKINFPFHKRNISEKGLFTNTNYYLDTLVDFTKEINSILNEFNKTRPTFTNSNSKINLSSTSWGFNWKYCIVDLDLNFCISNIEYSDKAIDLSNRTGILFLNHGLEDADQGIEYSVINGFIFNNGELCSSLMKIIGQYTNRIANTENKKTFIIACQNEDFDYFNEDELIETLYFEDLNNPETIPDPFSIEDVFSAVISNNNSFSFLEALSSNEIEVLFRNPQKIPTLGYGVIDFMDRFDRSLINNDDYPEKTTDLDVVCLHDAFTLCQDGICFNSNLWGLFPIGVFKIRCNLTASSRLPLNVTRHGFSEIHSEIEPWIKSVGLFLQKSILNSTKEMLKDANLTFDKQELKMLHLDGCFLSEELQKQFFKLK